MSVSEAKSQCAGAPNTPDPSTVTAASPAGMTWRAQCQACDLMPVANRPACHESLMQRFNKLSGPPSK